MVRKRVDLRLDEGLLGRVDATAELRGQTRTKFVERALEAALTVPRLDSLGPSPSPALLEAAAEESMRQGYVEGALERVESSRAYACPKAGCLYVSDSPGMCVHHRTERLR